MLRELYDDLKRFVRDREVNGQRYYKLTVKGNSTPPPQILFNNRYFIQVLATLQQLYDVYAVMYHVLLLGERPLTTLCKLHELQ